MDGLRECSWSFGIRHWFSALHDKFFLSYITFYWDLYNYLIYIVSYMWRHNFMSLICGGGVLGILFLEVVFRYMVDIQSRTCGCGRKFSNGLRASMTIIGLRLWRNVCILGIYVLVNNRSHIVHGTSSFFEWTAEWILGSYQGWLDHHSADCGKHDMINGSTSIIWPFSSLFDCVHTLGMFRSWHILACGHMVFYRLNMVMLLFWLCCFLF